MKKKTKLPVDYCSYPQKKRDLNILFSSRIRNMFSLSIEDATLYFIYLVIGVVVITFSFQIPVIFAIISTGPPLAFSFIALLGILLGPIGGSIIVITSWGIINLSILLYGTAYAPGTWFYHTMGVFDLVVWLSMLIPVNLHFKIWSPKIKKTMRHTGLFLQGILLLRVLV
ncbi:MAG: hypothetical protein ACTSUV_03525 [Candidatus Ranarchaeia archaeon]